MKIVDPCYHAVGLIQQSKIEGPDLLRLQQWVSAQSRVVQQRFVDAGSQESAAIERLDTDVSRWTPNQTGSRNGVYAHAPDLVELKSTDQIDRLPEPMVDLRI